MTVWELCLELQQMQEADSEVDQQQPAGTQSQVTFTFTVLEQPRADL